MCACFEQPSSPCLRSQTEGANGRRRRAEIGPDGPDGIWSVRRRTDFGTSAHRPPDLKVQTLLV